jgi:2-aminoethylphosphonate-pyruvate transaminase
MRALSPLWGAVSARANGLRARRPITRIGGVVVLEWRVQVTTSSSSTARSAIILAAGLGSRLGETGRLAPKGLLRLGEESILEESVQRLLAVGIQRIVIVTGHLAEHLDPLEASHRGVVELVHNPHFADSGSMYSLFCARDLVDDDFLLLESDIVYERRCLTACLEAPSRNVVLLTGFSQTSDEVFVATRNSALQNMSKDRRALAEEVPDCEIKGELVGISRISQELFSIMIEQATVRFRTTRHMDYESDCLVAAARETPVTCLLIEDLICCEIDYAEHLARARDVIHPAVVRKDGVETGGADKDGGENQAAPSAEASR